MADSAIEWTDKTWNPVRGCAKVSAGCKHCYAETMAKRLRAMGQRGYLSVIDDRGRWTGVFETDPDKLIEPLGWRKPARAFVNSMSDIFGEGVPFEFIAAVFGVMAATPRHTYQVLTKRPARMLEFFAWLTEVAADEFCGSRVDLVLASAATHVNGDAWDRNLDRAGLAVEGGVWPLPNVWLGVSVEDQAAADERIPLLLQAPAALRFLSCEPLLGPLDLSPWIFPAGVTPLDWVIAGGESGPDARACKVSWVRGLVRQCAEAGVPVFVKQLGARPDFVEPLAGGGQSIESMLRHGEYEEAPIILRDRKGGDPFAWPEDLRVRQWPATALSDDGVW